MSRKCSVKGCPGQRNKRNSTETNTFFSFPLRNEGLLKKWLDKVELQSELSSVSKICNLHFENNCFVKIDNSIKLLPSSVPLEYKVSVCLVKPKLCRNFLFDNFSLGKRRENSQHEIKLTKRH